MIQKSIVVIIDQLFSSKGLIKPSWIKAEIIQISWKFMPHHNVLC